MKHTFTFDIDINEYILIAQAANTAAEIVAERIETEVLKKIEAEKIDDHIRMIKEKSNEIMNIKSELMEAGRFEVSKIISENKDIIIEKTSERLAKNLERTKAARELMNKLNEIYNE